MTKCPSDPLAAAPRPCSIASSRANIYLPVEDVRRRRPRGDRRSRISRAYARRGGTSIARSADLPLHQRRLAGVEPLGAVIRLLVLEGAVGSGARRGRVRAAPLVGRGERV